MFEDLCAILSSEPNARVEITDSRHHSSLTHILHIPAVRGARRFKVVPLPGSKGPVANAGFTELLLIELGGDLEGSAALVAERVASLLLPGKRWNSVSYLCSGLRGNIPADLPDHLYMGFSVKPEFMTFEEYVEWYEEHQAINVANTG